MKRRDDFQSVSDNLPRKVCTCCMRYRVVSVDQVELFEACDLHHLACERWSVQGEFKQRITCHLHFMVKHVAEVAVQTHGHGVADKVDLMSLVGECFSEFSCYNAAAAVCWVTNNTDSHGSIPLDEHNELGFKLQDIVTILKHQLLILNRSRRRAPNLHPLDRPSPKSRARVSR